MNAPMASLPVVIFQFAMTPYEDWQKLAWAGALLITVTVLALSILARSLTARKSMMNVAIDPPSTSPPATPRRRSTRAGLAEKVAIRNLDFFYGDSPAR